MGLLGTTTAESYYSQSQSFTGNGTAHQFVLLQSSFPTVPTAKEQFEVYINDILINPNNYSYNNSNDTITFTSTSMNTDVQTGSNGAPKTGLIVLVREVAETEQYGGYQYVDIEDVINNFMVSYVGEGKIINRVRKADVAFHAQRAIQEFSYDTFKSTKSQEIEVPPALTMILPQDFVNYVKLSYKDDSGTERVIYPIRFTSNPTSLLQDSNYKYLFDSNGNLQKSYNSNTWNDFKQPNQDLAEYSQQEKLDEVDINGMGGRYGLEPERGQSNGSYFIDQLKGTIYFSSNMFGKIITLKYISDGLGTDAEMVVHKFAEEAMYKYLAHAVLATKMNVPEYIVARFKREKFAATRNAKIRLSNLKSEELAQVMRNKSKQIKH
mgnify:CR=1 FL=1|tara:strand:- start:2106 stop:3245 length:1140 start_codon:yes stop_codon:yes gene_type:complete